MFVVFIGVLTMCVASEAKKDVNSYSNDRTVTSAAILFETPNIPAITQLHNSSIQVLKRSKNDIQTKQPVQVQHQNSSNLNLHNSIVENLKPPKSIQPENGFSISLEQPPLRMNRDSLSMKMDEEWTKSGHVNHIYIGRPLFPLITEESRVLDNKETLFNFPTTRKSVTQKRTPRGGGDRLGLQSKEQQVTERSVQSTEIPKFVSNSTSSEDSYEQISKLYEALRESLQKFMKLGDEEKVKHRVDKRSSHNDVREKTKEKKIFSGLKRHFIPDWVKVMKGF